MARAIVKTLPSAAVGAIISTHASYPIGEFKDFDITIRCSSSTGLVYSILTAPANEDAMFLSQTGGAFIAGTCATITHHFLNNNMMHLRVASSATAAVSGSHIRIVISCIERP